MLWVQKWPIFPPFFQVIQVSKMTFTILYNEKTSFQAIKTRSSRSKKKNDIFLKGLTHGFGPKMALFPTFFLGNIGKENVFYDFPERTNSFLGYKNKKVQKVEKLTFFQRGQPMVFVQKWQFFQLLFFGNIGQEIVFYDILERKNAVLGCKNNKFKKFKN